jgi:transketolase
MATIKPIDGELLARCAKETGCFVTAEDHNIHGGLGSAVAESLAATIPCPIEFVGVRDVFGASGEPEELAQAFGLTAPFIAQAARDVIARKKARRKESA